MPKNIMKHFIKNDFIGKKGSVFNTAIISGIMAAKKVYEIIPLCHNIIIDYCKIKINISEDNEIWINCIVKTNNKTGVEMEALLGASIAALTIYDMCKSMSKNIIIKETKLLKKTGGKSDF
jgi:cyclic pyranopterin phosphate synthase